MAAGSAGASATGAASWAGAGAGSAEPGRRERAPEPPEPRRARAPRRRAREPRRRAREPRQRGGSLGGRSLRSRSGSLGGGGGSVLVRRRRPRPRGVSSVGSGVGAGASVRGRRGRGRLGGRGLLDRRRRLGRDGRSLVRRVGRGRGGRGLLDRRHDLDGRLGLGLGRRRGRDRGRVRDAVAVVILGAVADAVAVGVRELAGSVPLACSTAFGTPSSSESSLGSMTPSPLVSPPFGSVRDLEVVETDMPDRRSAIVPPSDVGRVADPSLSSARPGRRRRRCPVRLVEAVAGRSCPSRCRPSVLVRGLGELRRCVRFSARVVSSEGDEEVDEPPGPGPKLTRVPPATAPPRRAGRCRSEPLRHRASDR